MAKINARIASERSAMNDIYRQLGEAYYAHRINGGEGEPVEIKESKLRGVASYGMICGAVEIGLADLFPTHEEAHILDLSAFPAGRS